MGVGVDVESIVTSLVREDNRPDPLGKRVRMLNEQARLKAITDKFDWTIPSWQEPSPIRGLDTSIGNGRYSLLLSLAWAIEDLEGYTADNLDQIVEIVEHTRRSPSEHQYEQLRGNCKLFPHLLDRNIYESIYLPVEFGYPIHLNASTHDRNGIIPDRRDEFSIASSIKLTAELAVIEPIIWSIVGRRGEDSHIPSYSNYTWGSVYEVSVTLQQAAHDSLRLNLPFKITW